MTKPSNPRRSGGPRTVEGRLVTSANSLRSGAYARQVVLPGESQAEFDLFLAGFVQEYQPQTATELFLVQNMVGWMWKMLRLERLEAAAQLAEMSAPVKPFELARFGMDVPDGGEYYLEDLSRIDALDEQLFRVVGPVAELLNKQYRVGEESLSLAKSECPEFFGVLQGLAAEDGITDLSPAGLASATVQGVGIDRVQWVKGALSGLIKETSLAIWALDNREAIRSVRGAVSDARLQSMQHYVQPKMAFDHVSRSLYRAIDELRRHQTWRQRAQVIDVTPGTGNDKG